MEQIGKDNRIEDVQPSPAGSGSHDDEHYASLMKQAVLSIVAILVTIIIAAIAKIFFLQ